MVYRKLDPGADWDAWCDDHPDEPDREEIDEAYWLLECTGCGNIPWDEAELVIEYEHLPSKFKCDDCGAVAYDEGEWDVKQWLEDGKEAMV